MNGAHTEAGRGRSNAEAGRVWSGRGGGRDNAVTQAHIARRIETQNAKAEIKRGAEQAAESKRDIKQGKY